MRLTSPSRNFLANVEAWNTPTQTHGNSVNHEGQRAPTENTQQRAESRDTTDEGLSDRAESAEAIELRVQKIR
jgi:hypothetical protein